MSIHGIPSTNLPNLYPTRAEPRTPAQTNDVAPAKGQTAAAVPARTDEAQIRRDNVRDAAREANRVVPRPTSAVPADAPEGVDPQLWSVLTADERSFFARSVSQGPLTYTRMMNQINRPSAAAMPRGGRMDVRV
ncbi:MAG: hypothetical protein KF709_10475 [Gemmatimonadaceae bacterium]|nr:hypothetical protein [Gemmatimonadaceae bacterium]